LRKHPNIIIVLAMLPLAIVDTRQDFYLDISGGKNLRQYK
jgi:hypothetical protein